MSQNVGLEVVRSKLYEDSSAEFVHTNNIESSNEEMLQEIYLNTNTDNSVKPVSCVSVCLSSENSYDHEGNIQSSWINDSERNGSISDQTVCESSSLNTDNKVILNNVVLVFSNTNNENLHIESKTDNVNNDNQFQCSGGSPTNSVDLSSEVLSSSSISDGSSMSDISTESNPISEGCKELDNIEKSLSIDKDNTTNSDNSSLLEKYKNEALELRNSIER